VSGLLAVFAHPDDESMGAAGLLCRHTRAGVPVHLICATRGALGWMGKPAGARPEDLPEIRTGELEQAAQVLGLAGVTLWDYPDGGVEASDQAEITSRLLDEIRRFRPDAIVGWGPDGGYGHPDHICIGRCTDAAVASLPEAERPALYHMVIDQWLVDAYKDIISLVSDATDSLPLVASEVDLVVDLTDAELDTKQRAIECHQSQQEDWRVAVKGRPDLLRRGYGHEPYARHPQRGARLAANNLLKEFA
jgi:LmbE family N-acetylglucosaminyl deacetylase